VTDHLDQAATRALEIAAQIRDPETSEMRVAAAYNALEHLTYLAGLIRGGAVRPVEEELSVAVPVSDEESKARVEVGGDGVIRTFNAAGQQVWPSVEDERDRARAQLDDLLRVAKDVIACGNLENRACLREAVDRIEGDT
jgi:hypothetical protein